MRAVWYERFGPSADVLTLGDTETPTPKDGEVLVRLRATAVNPSDVKLRAGARPGATMDWPRIIPHSDGAGLIEAVGPGVRHSRIGERVWIWNGAWQRPFGTAAEYIALPSRQAVALSNRASFDVGACLGIPAMTAWYALWGDGGPGPANEVVLVTGGAGTVGRYACQMAQLAGAQVITTVSSPEKARHAGVDTWIDYRNQDVSAAVMEITRGRGVDRIVDVDFAANQDTAQRILRPGGTIAAYASASQMVPELQFYPLMFRNITLRMLIAYLIPDHARRAGEAQIANWLDTGALSHAPVHAGALADCAAAHDRVAAGSKMGTVVLTID